MSVFHHVCHHGIEDEEEHELDIREEKTGIVDAYDLMTSESDREVIGVYVPIHSADKLCQCFFGHDHPHYVRISLFTGLHLREPERTQVCQKSSHPVFNEELFLGVVQTLKTPFIVFNNAYVLFQIMTQKRLGSDIMIGEAKVFLKDDGIATGNPFILDLKCASTHHDRGTLKVSILLADPPHAFKEVYDELVELQNKSIAY